MGNYQPFYITKQGKKYKECQDKAYAAEHFSSTIAIVSDGLGTCFRSKCGAELAVWVTHKALRFFVEHYQLDFEQAEEKGSESVKEQLIKHIIIEWRKGVDKNYENNPFTEKELAANDKYQKAYSATLIAAAVTDKYWLGFHIGDGRFTVLYEDGSFDQPVPWDERCVGRETTSICDEDAFERVRVRFFPITPEKPPPVAVFLCSDGIDDNYPNYENEVGLNLDKFYSVYRSIAQCFAEDGFESAKERLEELVEKFANEGKCDDSSIAGFIDMERLKKVVSVWGNKQ